MTAPKTRPATIFVVSGIALPPGARALARRAAPEMLPAGLLRGRIKQSVRLTAQREEGASIRLAATPGEDVVVLHIAGGPALVLHPEHARDLLLAQSGVDGSREGGRRNRMAHGEVRIPVGLQWKGLEWQPRRGAGRSAPESVLVSAIDIVTGLGKDSAANFVASEVVRRVDAQVDPGVYQLASESLPKLKGAASPLPQLRAPDGKALLVLVHGTFSDTSGTFGKLWVQHAERVKALFDHYEQRVFAFEHPTLGVGPIENALALAKACAPGTRLHLVTHSRGGLVAEVMARVCANAHLGADDFAFFAGTAYRPQRTALKALGEIVARRKIRVERVVRVACPSRGTLLASKRLDAYVSVLKWALELAGIPVASAIVDFLGEVARRRADAERLPGLAAQIPDSPLLRWLHAGDAPIPGELRVVAGDIEGDSVVSWLKTLMSDAFFWTDNDLVVQTRSMYSGAARAAGATFLFDQGGKVSHFNYFGNARTAAAVVDALLEDDPQGFRVIGPMSWAGASATGVRGAARNAGDRTSARAKPAVVVLPGMLGSNLKADGKRIWPGHRRVDGVMRLGYRSGRSDGVEADGLVNAAYDDLGDYLAETHEVIEFAYDWRRPMEEEARRLAELLGTALDARASGAHPVRLLAHSTGGLIARTLQLERPDIWERMMSHPGARLLMLGTPNEGCWTPMQVLSGDDTFGNTLLGFGAPFRDHVVRQMMASLPGFIQLQAGLTDTALALDRHATWQRLAEDDNQAIRACASWHREQAQRDTYAWGVPPQRVIDRAVALRRRLDAQREHDLTSESFAGKMLLVVGRARLTPEGIATGATGFEYLNAVDAGDGRTTLASARLPGVPTWQIECEHGDLPAKRDAFPAYLELLTDGTTGLLSRLGDSLSTRAAAPLPAHESIRTRPSRARPSGQPPETPRELFAPAAKPMDTVADPVRPVLQVSVINGDLLFVPQPLLLGHYASLRLTGTERVVDQLLGGAMSAALGVGAYPNAPGDHRIFVNTGVNRDNPMQLPRPKAAIVVALGEEGKLRPAEFALSVCQAVIGWSQRLTENPGGAPASFEIASTLIGSGGVDIAVAQAALLIAQGVRDANERLAETRWPVVGHLHVVELYLDRACEVWRALQAQAEASPGDIVVAETVRAGPGALPRLIDSGYRGADYDFMSALTQEAGSGETFIAYTLDTKRARTEVRAQAAQSRLLRQLITTASADRSNDSDFGRTLFRLLVPAEMEPFLGGTTEMQLEVDGGTAGIPWELLESGMPGAGESRPWAIRAKLLRKLRIADFRADVTDAPADASALVIGEPACDPKVYPRLPGAREEARAVAECLAGTAALGSGRVMALVSPDDPGRLGPDARTIVEALLGRDWRIVHIAGHGAPPELMGPAPGKEGDPAQQVGNPRGVVLSDRTYLGPREIRNMRVVPELVFVNCCHLAARSAAQVLAQDATGVVTPNRPRFAAGVAEELIKIGVRCVIAAGWAVDDAAASEFAVRLYGALVRGRRFIDAVAEAREAAHAMGGSTWAAYQCYGDPDWCFVRNVRDAQRPAASLADEFAGVAESKGLVLALETLAVRSRYQKASAQEQRTKILHLEARFAARWRRSGEVAEAFGRAWDAAGNRPAAIEWYTRALGANDGTASLKAVEQLANLRARHASSVADDATREFARRAGMQARSARAKTPRGNARNAKAAAALDAVLDGARDEIAAALGILEQVTALHSTTERESVCGSAWKRLAMLEAAARRPGEEGRAIQQMKLHYGRAETLAWADNDPQLFYPALNRMAAELVIDAGKPSWRKFDPAVVDAVRASLAAKARDDPDFWSVVGLTELRTYVAIADRKLARELDIILAELADLHARVSAPSEWGSVLDQLRFVLPKYAARASAAEGTAVATLMAHLSGYAGFSAEGSSQAG